MRRLFVPVALAIALGLSLGLLRRAGAEEAPPAAPANPAGPAAATPLPLRVAVARGLLRARGHRPNSYASIELELENPGSAPVEVDLCASFLTPRGGPACQRLGLGPVITPRGGPSRVPGSVMVTVPPQSTSKLRVATVCLDISKPCPTDQTFLPSPDALPPVRERVLRWWADHPETDQGVVNSAIWRNAPEVDVAAAQAARRSRGALPALRGALRGSTTYLLRAGALLARDADGVERFLATQIADVFPVEGALYAVARVGDAQELWRYVETGEELWKPIAALPDDLEILSLEPLEGGGLVVASASHVLRLAPGGRVFEPLFELPQKAHQLSFQLLSRGRVRVGLTLKATDGVYQGGEQEHAQSARSELWLIEPAGARPPEKLKTYWNVAGIAQGPGGAFALTNAGHLRVLKGESFRDQPGPDGLADILHVGREHLWARTRDDGLVCVRLATGAFTRAALPYSESRDLRFDGLNADLSALRGDALVRVSGTTGAVTQLEAAARAPAR